MTDPQSPILPPEFLADAPLVRIGPFNNLLDAEMAKARLCDEGIRASLAGEHVAAMLGPIYGAAYAGGPFVLVPANEEANARAIIASTESARRERTDAESPPCSKCGHQPTEQVLHGMRWAAIGLLAVSVFLPMPYRIIVLLTGGVLLIVPTVPIWRCVACHHRFAVPKPANASDEDIEETDV